MSAGLRVAVDPPGVGASASACGRSLSAYLTRGARLTLKTGDRLEGRAFLSSSIRGA